MDQFSQRILVRDQNYHQTNIFRDSACQMVCMLFMYVLVGCVGCVCVCGMYVHMGCVCVCVCGMYVHMGCVCVCVWDGVCVHVGCVYMLVGTCSDILSLYQHWSASSQQQKTSCTSGVWSMCSRTSLMYTPWRVWSAILSWATLEL